jgi:diguanylate cyclase (GGDEF)-like protein
MPPKPYASTLSKMTDFTAGDVIRALTGKREPKMSDRIAVLGIPQAEVTQSVSLAVSALLEKIDDLNRELTQVKDQYFELEQLVDVDCLAPIPNRRAFMRRLKWAAAMFERHGHPSSILYLDINDFKKINDNFGHDAGDKAIQHIAQILLSSMRESDFLARLGGDEFALILYYAENASALERGKKIAERIKNSALIYNGKPIAMTSSFGAYTLQKGDTAETALTSADMAMYVDKKRSKERATNISA